MVTAAEAEPMTTVLEKITAVAASKAVYFIGLLP